jgi:hypothetical protein
MKNLSPGVRNVVAINAAAAVLGILLGGCGNTQSLHPAPQATIVCWGDSMTEGNAGIADQGRYPALLQQEIGATVINQGVGGQTSTQIGVRQGGVPTYVTVDGGTIPGNGFGVTVTFNSGYEPLTSPNGRVNGSIQGVKGELTLSTFLPQGTFTFTRTSDGDGPVSVTGAPQYVPDKPYSSDAAIFWEGRNNLLNTPAGPWGAKQILSDIAAQVGTVPPGTNYLVLSVLNENDPDERKGGANYSSVLDLNNSLSSTYGSHYLDVRSLLVSSFDQSLPADITDHDYDMPPGSLSAISAQGTLNSDISSTDKSFSVDVTAGTLRMYHTLVIDQESIRILGVNGSTVTAAVRGYGGIMGSHSAGTAVTEHDPTHLNMHGNLIVAKACAAKLASLSAQPAPTQVQR